MNTPAPSPTKHNPHFHAVAHAVAHASGKRSCDNHLKLDELKKRFASVGMGFRSNIPPYPCQLYHEMTPKERVLLEKQMKERDEAVQKAEREAKAIRDAEGRVQSQADVMALHRSNGHSKIEVMERQLRKMAKRGDRSMRRIQKEMEIMAMKRQDLDRVADDAESLESRMEGLVVGEEEDMEIEKE